MQQQRFPFGVDGYRELELSSQVLIEAALQRGLEAEVLERRSNSLLLREPGNGRSEIVIQATKTSADSYVCAEIMALKDLTKLLLARAGLRVPKGKLYQSIEAALADWPEYFLQLKNGGSLIVKPNACNFGIAVSKLDGEKRDAGETKDETKRETPSEDLLKQDFLQALEQAFANDQNILVEEFISGEEYRFIVIGGKFRAVLQRIPANVCGDGTSSIAELVAEKNRDPWRLGEQGAHISPLERLELNETELEVLREQGLSSRSIPSGGETIFLRHNSNISTGGDSRNMTDSVHPGYARICERAAQALGAQICGVDLISADIYADPAQTEHAIIEANFNPAIYTHQYPAEGKSIPVAFAVLDMLFPPR